MIFFNKVNTSFEQIVRKSTNMNQRIKNNDSSSNLPQRRQEVNYALPNYLHQSTIKKTSSAAIFK